MMVSWQLPDGKVREQTVADTEQLMFLLRVVGGVSFDGTAYRIARTALVVHPEHLSIAVSLEQD